MPTTVSARPTTRRSPTAGASPGPTPGRRALPSGRAVVGAFLITASATAVLAGYTSANAGPRGRAVVATRAIDAGERLAEGDVRDAPVDLPEPTAAQVFPSAGPLTGAVALAPIAEGELLPRSAVRLASGTPAGEALAREFSFAVERERAVDGQLARGDRIDLLATFGNGEDAATIVIGRGIELRRVAEPGKGGLGGNGKLTLTVALADADAVTRVAHASRVAALTVVRSTGAADASGAIAEYRLAEPSSSGTLAPRARP